MLRKLPLLLILFRLLAGIIILLTAYYASLFYKILAPVLLTLGLLSDIFDGIIARKLNISTIKLRRLDSLIDQIFWCVTGFSLYVLYPAFFNDHSIQIGILIGIEVLCYVISYIKFRKEVATHAISSKCWVLILFALLIEVMISGNSSVLFEICFYTGMITRLEIVVILLILKEWTNDVPSVYHAILLRAGKPIKRNALLNG